MQSVFVLLLQLEYDILIQIKNPYFQFFQSN